MDWLIHIANVLFLLSYSVRDILWLRALTVVASIPLLAWFALHAAEPDWVPIGWNLVFLSINGYQLVRLLSERRPVVLRADELRLHQLVFSALRPRQMLALSRAGAWRDAEPSTVLARAGEPLSELMVLSEGCAAVHVAGARVAELGPGKLIGEMSFLTDATPRADVVLTAPSRYLAWDKRALHAFLEQHPEVRAAMQRAIGADLCAKLRR